MRARSSPRGAENRSRASARDLIQVTSIDAMLDSYIAYIGSGSGKAEFVKGQVEGNDKENIITYMHVQFGNCLTKTILKSFTQPLGVYLNDHPTGESDTSSWSDTSCALYFHFLHQIMDI